MRALRLALVGLWPLALLGSVLLSQSRNQGKQDYYYGMAAGISRPVGRSFLLVQVILPGRGEAGRGEDSKPDLITAVDISRTAGSLRDVSINTTVKNVGSALCPESLCDVIFHNARPPRQVLKKVQQKIRELDPGDAYTFSFTITTGFGMYEVCAFADAKKSVDESDETNNRSCTMLEGK